MPEFRHSQQEGGKKDLGCEKTKKREIRKIL
jgi:hypothetical protein